MRPTDKIDDPTWDDVTDRDALIRKLAHAVRGQLFEKDGRPDLILIDDIIEDALLAIGDTHSPLPTRTELAEETAALLVSDPQGGYTGTL